MGKPSRAATRRPSAEPRAARAGGRGRRLARYLYYPLAVALAGCLVHESREATRLLGLAAEMNSLGGAAGHAWEALLERLSLTLYDGASERAAAYTHVVGEAAAASRNAAAAAAALALAALLHLALVLATAGRAPARLAWHLALVAAVAFAAGISAPMLTLRAFTELPLLGEVVLRYDAKSILSTVGELAAERRFALCALVTAFSLVLPLLKLVLVALVAGAPAGAAARRAAALLHALGRWSMADVFVVAILVAFLAFEADASSEATVGLGAWCFAAYCLLSMVAAGFAARAAEPAGG